MTRAKIQDLIDRIEALTPGEDTRALADEVLLVLGWVNKNYEERGWAGWPWIMPDGKEWGTIAERPNPLDSLDAAIDLKLEEWGFGILFDFPLGPRVYVTSQRGKPSHPGYPGSAIDNPVSVLPAYFTLAILRAMLAMEMETG